jgi:transcription elongation factor SPT4
LKVEHRQKLERDETKDPGLLEREALMATSAAFQVAIACETKSNASFINKLNKHLHSIIRIRLLFRLLFHNKSNTKPPQANMSLRGLRACMVCSIVQAGTKFVSNGCPNCDEFLEMRHSADVVQDCTSAVFEGMIAMADPATSWVAKWQRLEGYAPGTYAVKVEGVVSLLEIQCVRQRANFS